MAKATKSKKKPIGQYDHKGKKRVNNPPVGLVTPETDRETGKKKYAYDPHLDPGLQFDSQRSQVEKIIDNGLSGETVEDVKTALQELKKRQAPYLNWAGKAERTSFEAPTVSLHVHERIDPRTIVEAVRRRNGEGVPVQGSLFELKEENPPLREAIEFYKHPHNWSRRLLSRRPTHSLGYFCAPEGLRDKALYDYMS